MWIGWVAMLGAALGMGAAASAAPKAAPGTPPIQLALDASEAQACLAILDEENAGRPVAEADWRRLFSSQPYQWLVAREATFGHRMDEAAFRAFLADPKTRAKARAWRETLDHMTAADMPALGRGVLAWLPPGARIAARVFPEIKPTSNSFVWTKPDAGPAIFLNVENQSRDQFENTVSHELHHIGLNSLDDRQTALQAGLSDRVKLAMKWMTAFGEGEAMLAAAGSTERHPHWEDDALIRARWDSDMAHFNADVGAVTALLNDILDGRLTTDDEIRRRAAPFWGVQGAWYTVGYEMAVLVDKRFGRAVLNDCLLDPRELLTRYNAVAREANAQGASLALWPDALIAQLKPAG
jgi:hypothetical protein